MKRIAPFFSTPLFKIIVFISVFVAGYWFLEHWDDFKAGLNGGFVSQTNK